MRMSSAEELRTRVAVQERVIAIGLAEHETLRAALEGLVKIIDAAGLLNLSNGVQLGQTSWYVKAHDALEAARDALKVSTP
jgi:hypothetical protein